MAPIDRQQESRLPTHIDPEHVSHEAEPTPYPEIPQEQNADLAGEGNPDLEPLEQRDA